MGSRTALPVWYFLHDLVMGGTSHNGSRQAGDWLSGEDSDPDPIGRPCRHCTSMRTTGSAEISVTALFLGQQVNHENSEVQIPRGGSRNRK